MHDCENGPQVLFELWIARVLGQSLEVLVLAPPRLRDWRDTLEFVQDTWGKSLVDHVVGKMPKVLWTPDRVVG